MQESRKRCPTGTWDLNAAVPASDTVRQRLVTGEQTVVRRQVAAAPPTPPALQPLFAALELSANRSQASADALRQLTACSQQTERAVFQATAYYSDQARDIIEAVKQGNVLHEQSNALLRQTVTHLRECSASWDALADALTNNTRVMRQAKKSRVVRFAYRVSKNPTQFIGGILFTAVFVFVYAIVSFIMKGNG